MGSRVTALLTGFELDEGRRVQRRLSARGLDAWEMEWSADLVDVVLERRFDAVVVRYPLPGPSLARFLTALRGADSPCRHTGLVLSVREDCVDLAREFLGHGVNRVVPAAEPVDRLVEAVFDLLEVAPRQPLQLRARVVVQRPGLPAISLCQTVNISRTGMLLRGFGHYPVGAPLDFELVAPSGGPPIRGRASVARQALPEREGLEGFGARFLALAADDWDRLDGLLEARQS